SWNEDGSTTEPWMYPEVLPQVRAALALRERLVPYLYTLLYRAHAEHAPVLSPLFLAFPDDPACYAEDDSFLVGAGVLVAPVVEP
ncbi:family 31 glucosidase, partial [Mycobacterium tuberculosis]|nr:family 31 glucosidase [Mycobacterium tuberculosis]